MKMLRRVKRLEREYQQRLPYPLPPDMSIDAQIERLVNCSSHAVVLKLERVVKLVKKGFDLKAQGSYLSALECEEGNRLSVELAACMKEVHAALNLPVDQIESLFTFDPAPTP